MAKDIAIIQVCFNVLDPYQKLLYERAASFPNRSGYVKRLIQREVDIDQGLVIQSSQKAGSVIIDDFNADGFI